MKVNVAVCGHFHYLKWIKYLWETGMLEKFYYSYKISSDFGIPKQIARNKFSKAYLRGLHGVVLRDRFLAPMLPFYLSLWESAVLKDWIKSDVFHVLLDSKDGTALRLINRCREEGTHIFGEAVNAHVDKVNCILVPEYERLDLSYPRFDNAWERIKHEYDRCQSILVPSEWVATSFLQAGFQPDRIYKLPYPSGSGGNQAGMKKKSEPGRTVRVLCVASIQVRKGQYYLMEAVRHLNKQNSRIKFEITLVGSVGNSDYFYILRKMGVSFDHIAHIPNEKMVDAMSGFDIFVLPSLEDGFGLVVSEALQAGFPVVTTRNAGAADAIVDGQNGFVVPAQDSIALANAIMNAVDLTPEPGFVAPDQIPDWRTYTERLIQVYRTSLSPD